MRPTKRIVPIVTATLCSLAFPLSLSAATSQSTLQVKVTIPSSCQVNTTPLDFGSVDPTSATLPFTQTGTVSVKCTSTTAYTIALDAGQNGTSGSSSRSMKNSGTSEKIGYEIYTTDAHSTVWSGSTTVGGTGDGTSKSHTVYGSIPNLDGAKPGAYTDSVTVTLTYN